jgi:hypothetical protein
VIRLPAALVLSLSLPAPAAPVFGRVERDEGGHIVRHRARILEFQRRARCPATGQRGGKCPGHVVDHVVPLCAGGRDTPANMQYQQAELARAKDVLELQLCGARVSPEKVVAAWCRLGIASGAACER